MKTLLTIAILCASATAVEAGWQRRCVNCAPVRVQPARVVAVTPAPVAVDAAPLVLRPYLVPRWNRAILPCRRGFVYRLEYLPEAAQGNK